MNILWDWSLDTETDRIIDTASCIGKGFFRVQKFLPLPWSPGIKYLPNGVYLPQLPYNSIHRLWHRASLINNRQYPLRAPSDLVQQVKALIATLNLQSPLNNSLQDATTQSVERALRFLKDLSPSAAQPKQIVIYPTYFGTGGSFNLLNKDGKIVIYLRLDRGIKTIVECILTSILRPPAISNLQANWSETEFLVDWIISSSKLANLLPADPTWSGTLNETRTSMSPDLISESEEFLEGIGAPNQANQKFLIKNEQIYFGHAPLTNLTHRETVLMKKLILKSPEPINFDEIANILFTKDNDFSLAAIAKTVERIRTKLSNLGISDSYIATASKVGYYLLNV